MNFDPSPEQQAAQARARAFAATLQSCAADIDRDARVPGDVQGEASALLDGDELSTLLGLEEIAAESAAVAIAAAARTDVAAAPGLSGLRGAPALEDSPRAQLALAAIALGVGRKALDQSLEELRRATAVRGAEVEKPHWVAADVATELDAARLMTHKAARTGTAVDIALARLMASAAAERATAAALRIVGAHALDQGSTLERLARDARAIAVLLGTEERWRAIAADGLYPR
jgi:hypothetical protein